MWHEARKQEKRIREIMVDLKRRAERRKEYFERIKRDPAEFLQVWGRQCKIQLDPAVALAASNAATMTTWQGDASVQIDRFDVRAHLDYIDDYDKSTESKPSESERNEERMCNYERYRLLVQNDVTGITEEQCLKQIQLDEKYGYHGDYVSEQKRPFERKAEIAYAYDDPPTHALYGEPLDKTALDSDPDDDLDSIDLDMVVDVDQLNEEHKELFNRAAVNFGMEMGDYVRMLILDKEEMDNLREQRLLEAEKAQYSGRKARRERRLAKEKRLKNREFSPPSYIARESPKYNPYEREFSISPSRSNSPLKERTTFITSYGDHSDDEQSQKKQRRNIRLKSAKSTSPVKILTSLQSQFTKKVSSDLQKLRNITANDDDENFLDSVSTDSDVKEKTPKKTNEKVKARTSSSRRHSSTADTDSEEQAIEEYLRRKETHKKILEKCKSVSGKNSNDKVINHQEEMKKKMQALLRRQVKRDREAKKEKMEREEKERMERAVEIRELSFKLRQRERERRRRILSSTDSDYSIRSPKRQHRSSSSSSCDTRYSSRYRRTSSGRASSRYRSRTPSSRSRRSYHHHQHGYRSDRLKKHRNSPSPPRRRRS